MRKKRGADNKNEPSPFWRQLDQVVLIGLFSAIFIAVRIALVSNGNSELAKILLVTADPLKIFMSSIIPNAGTIALIACYFSYARGRWTDEFDSDSIKYWFSHGMTIMVLSIGIVLVNRIGALLITAFLFWRLLVYLSHRFRNPKLKRLARIMSDRETVTTNMTTLIFLLFIIPSAIWLPPENIALVDETKLTAFVLSSDTNFVTVLVASSESVRILKVKDIKSREICSNNSNLRPLFPILEIFRSDIEQTSVPECWNKLEDSERVPGSNP